MFASLTKFISVNFENDSLGNFETVSPCVNLGFSVISNQQTEQVLQLRITFLIHSGKNSRLENFP